MQLRRIYFILYTVKKSVLKEMRREIAEPVCRFPSDIAGSGEVKRMLTAMIAEDELLVRIGIAGCVPWAEMGIVLVGEAENGEAGWELYQRYRPDILITDIRMPLMSGIELVRRIRTDDRHCGVIVVTNVENAAELEEVRKLGVSDILFKAAMKKEDIGDAVRRVQSALQNEQEYATGDRPADMQWRHILFENRRETAFKVSDSVSREAELPYTPKGVTAIRFFPNEWMTPALKRSLTQMILRRMEELGACASIDQGGCRFFIWNEVPESCSLSEALMSAASCVQDNFRINMGIVMAAERAAPEQYSSLAPHVIRLLHDPMLFDGSVLMLDALGNFDDPRLNALRNNLMLSLPLCAHRERILPLIRLLDRYPGPLDNGFEQVLMRAVPLLKTLGLSEKQSGLQKMTDQICTAAEEQVRNDLIRVRPEIRLAMDYVHAHAGEELSLEQVSTIANFQSTYFSRLFKNETHCSFSDYLFQVRMLHAQELLRTTDFPVSDVAKNCGFSDLSYFGMRFRLFSGMTPREWRESVRKVSG